MNGCAERVRAWWDALIAGENEAAPPELLPKLRLVEGILPMAGPLLGMRGVRTVSDLLPADDETMAAMLGLVHDWSGRMLGPDESPASSDALEAGEHLPVELPEQTGEGGAG